MSESTRTPGARVLLKPQTSEEIDGHLRKSHTPTFEFDVDVHDHQLRYRNYRLILRAL
jgi:hypothetical protein